MKLKTYAVIAEALEAHGVDTIFGLMTSDNMSLFNHLVDKGIKVVRARTEHGAICMADGYSRATGRIGVASVGAGPSAGMTGTSLVTAQRRRSPLVVICGDVPVNNRHHLKWFDQQAFFKDTAGHCVTMASTRTAVEDTYQVLRRAQSGVGPAVLNVPVDILEAEVDMENIGGSWRYLSPWIAPAMPYPNQAAIEEAATILANSKRPLFIAGRGAVMANARDKIVECADRVGGLLGTTIQAQHYFKHDFYLGTIGGLGFGSCMQIVDKADVVVAVGASLNVYTSSFGELFPNAKIIQIDSSPDAFGAMTPADVSILADAELSMVVLADELDRAGMNGRTGARDEETRSDIAGGMNSISRDYVKTPGVLDPRQLLDVLQSRLPATRTDVVDAGHFLFFVMDHIRAAEPQNRIWTADFASIGISVSAGIGAAIAIPDRQTVVYVGDGGFMMSLLELDTAVRHKVPLVIVVVNDEAYGAEVRYLQNRKTSDALAKFESPDICAVAKGLGCEVAVVTNVDELETACSRIGTYAVPFVIDARVDPNVAHREYANRQGSVADADQ